MIEFIWHPPTADLYSHYLNKVTQPNLLQSYPYALAIRKTQYLAPIPATIIKDGKEIGFFQAFEAKTVFGAFHVITLDRGPCWFKGAGSDEDWKMFTKALNHAFPKRFGRKRRFMPERHSDQSTEFFEVSGWHKREKAEAYKTLWLDLTPSLENLRAGLAQKWRNALNKAQRQDIDIQIKQDITAQALFLKHYLQDRLDKKYAGASPAFLKVLMETAQHTDDLIIAETYQKGRLIAAQLFITHGKAATYQAGWSSRQGRASNAHTLSLWQVMEQLKDKGVIWLDLGGIRHTDNEGLTRFKKGTGGQIITLTGQYG